ncbi:MAG: PAS domain S-box protein [Betaproteobacteria bacterium]|nr:PAS domain S-box protein [Betaproteobacteria bacterium]
MSRQAAGGWLAAATAGLAVWLFSRYLLPEAGSGVKSGIRSGAGFAAGMLVATAVALVVACGVYRYRCARRSVAESELRYRTLYESTPAMMHSIDVDGKIVSVSEQWLKTLGYARHEVLGRQSTEFLTEASRRHAVETVLPEFFRTGVCVDAPYQMRAKNGRVLDILLSATVERDTGGRILRSLAVIRDITEHKRLEQSAAESERRMQALLDASPESTMLLDPGGKVLAINQVAARRLGKAQEELVGQNFFDHVPPDLAETRRAYLQQAVATGDPQHVNDRRGAVEFENHICPVKGAGGAVESVAVYARDITQQQRTQRLDATFHRLDLMQLKWHMELGAIAQMFCEEIRPLFDLAAVSIARAETDGALTFVAAAAADGAFVERIRKTCRRWYGEPSCCLPIATVMHSGQMRKLNIDDPECASCREAVKKMGVMAALMMPLTLRDKAWGVLTLYARERGLFDQLDFSPRLAVIASRLCMSLESALQQEWLKLMDTALASAGNAVFVADAGGRITWANPSFERLSGYTLAEILGKTPRLFSSGAQNAEFYRNLWEKLLAGESWSGELVNVRRDGSRYTVNQTVTPLRNDNGEIGHFVSIQEDITERKAAEARIRHMANFDMLTDLPNRVMFFDRLHLSLVQARRDGHCGALLFLDLDRFKEVNDKLGHHIGDLLLKAVAGRLQAQVRESDTVARLAGDEFTVTLPKVKDDQDAVRVAEKIIAALAQPFQLEGNQVGVGVSIGAALFPDHGDSVEQVVNAADDAMYMAKRAGRNTVVVYGN